MRTDVTITLLAETGESIARWSLSNAQPTKATVPRVKGGSEEVAIEELVIQYERIDFEPVGG